MSTLFRDENMALNLLFPLCLGRIHFSPTLVDEEPQRFMWRVTLELFQYLDLIVDSDNH